MLLLYNVCVSSSTLDGDAKVIYFSSWSNGRAPAFEAGLKNAGSSPAGETNKVIAAKVLLVARNFGTVEAPDRPWIVAQTGKTVNMNKRLRKKKRVGEFVEMGFEIQVAEYLTGKWWPDQRWDDFSNFLDEKKFVCGGGPGGLFITKCGCDPNNKRKVCRGSVTEEERQMIAAWLVEKFGDKVVIGNLVDSNI